MLVAAFTETAIHVGRTQRQGSIAATLLLLCCAVSTRAHATVADGCPLEAASAMTMLQYKTHIKTDATAASHVKEPTWQELDNNGELSYTADIVVGSQTLKGILDTGSYELLVFSQKCDACGTAASYDTKSSENHSRLLVSYMHSFGSGDTESVGAVDSVAIAEHLIPEQFLWEVVDADMPLLRMAEFHAIVGMGPPEVPVEDAVSLAKDLDDFLKRYEATPETQKEYAEAIKNAYRLRSVLLQSPSLLENMGVQRFSHCLLRQPTAPGYWIWDDLDPAAQAGTFKQLELVGEVSWGVQLDGVSWNGGALSSQETFACEDGCAALLDSGTSLIAAPSSVVAEAVARLNRIGGSCDRLEELPDLVIVVDGIELRLPPWSYAAQVSGEVPPELRKHFPRLPEVYRACEVLMMTLDAETQLGPLWILGLPFFREYYTSFSLGEYPSSKSVRSIHVARSGEDCRPVNWEFAATMNRSMSTRIRKVDLSKLRVSPRVFKMLEARERFTI